MKIVIFQPMLKAYRVPLFAKLHESLAANGHELRVVFGMPAGEDLERKDNVAIAANYYFFEKSRWFFSNKLHVLQGVIGHVTWADIVVTEQANKHFHNYLLILLSLIRFKPFAYWGHGLNRQGNPHSVSEYLKKQMAVHVDWWFAYTGIVANYLEEIGYSGQRISVLNNSIDTQRFKLNLNNLTAPEVEMFRLLHAIPVEAQIGLFCGSLHKNKNIGFLLDSAVLIKQTNPNFVLIIGGEGEDRSLVERFAGQYDFIIYLGRLEGRKKDLAFKCADVFLNPCMVGLAILDAFSASLPLITTNQPAHSPEIDYLQLGHNGMISDYTVESYALMVISTLASPSLLNQLKANARISSENYSIENMVANFVGGLENFIAHLNTRKGILQAF
jgi:glycosyltransferase involved in cell wall biosynthesis